MNKENQTVVTPINSTPEQPIKVVPDISSDLPQEEHECDEVNIPLGSGDVAIPKHGDVPPPQHVTLTGDDLEDFRQWQANKRDRRISDLIKKNDKIFEARRNTLVLRRVKNHKDIAPDEHVLAYVYIYEMKDAIKLAGKKVSVTDNEIKAFLELDPDFESNPTLERIAEKANTFVEAEQDHEDDKSEISGEPPEPADFTD